MRISWSSLRTWETCRQKGTLMRAGKKAKVSYVRNFFPGRVTDRVVRYWLEEDPRNNLNRMPSMVADVIDKELGTADESGETVNWRHRTDRDEVRAQCVDAVTKIQPALEKYVLPYTWQVDFGFKTPILMRAPWGMDRVILNGFMDIIVFDPDTETWRIYDVKHTENAQYWKSSFGQLVFYGYENQIRTGKIPVEVGFFQPLVPEGIKRFAIDDSHVNALAGRVQAMAWESWSGEDTPRSDTKECTFCEVKHACVKFKPTQAPNGRSTVSLLG